jgi:PTS hybrid protein
MIGLVLVSHSSELARGLADLAGQMAGPEVQIVAVGGGPDGALGTDRARVEAAIAQADSGDGVVVLGDLGSAILTIRDVLAGLNGRVRVADAPLVEGAVAAAVTASAGAPLDVVVESAQEARGAHKL